MVHPRIVHTAPLLDNSGMRSEIVRQMKAARCISRKDYEQALVHLRAIKETVGPDPHTLATMAMCYERVGDPQSAIKAAEEALAIDSGHFASLQRLARIHLGLEDYAKAKDYVQRALEHYPAPLPPPPRVYFWLLRLLRVFPRVRRVEQTVRQDLLNPNRNNEQWFGWAQHYLTWYEREFEEKATYTVH